jgi:predicted dehydrogenase
MIARVHRRSALLAGARLAGVMGRDGEASARLAAEWGAEHAYRSIDQALADRLDVLHICTPNATHAGFARSALEAGVNVICEKPLCPDATEAGALAALARERGLVAAVPYAYRFHPLAREIKARRERGDFGPPHLIHGSYLQDWLLSPATSSWRVDPAEGGASRAFADIGSHWCDLVEWVSGERIAALIADIAVAIPRRPADGGATFSGDAPADAPTIAVVTEDIATVLFRTANGVPGSLTVSQVSAGRKNRLWFEIDGAERAVVFDQENPETVWLGGREATGAIIRDPVQLTPEARRLNRTPAGHVQGWEAGFESFVAEAYAAVAGLPAPDLPTFDDGARSVRLVQAVLASAAQRQWREVA